VVGRRGRPKRSALRGDPCAQDGEYGGNATRAPPLYGVPPGEVSHRIEREQPHEDPSPNAENVLCNRGRADDRARGEYQPEGPRENDRSAGAGDPIPGRQPTVIQRSPTPVSGCAPRCSSGQGELEEDDDAEQTRSGDANLDLGHKVIVSDPGAEGDPVVQISLRLPALARSGLATCEFARADRLSATSVVIRQLRTLGIARRWTAGPWSGETAYSCQSSAATR
jgi:hypothetical protein